MTMMMIIGIILLLLSSREALAQPYNSDCNFGSHAFEIELGRRDVEQSCFEFRGRRKCLYTFIPSNCTDVGKLPLVFDLHDQSGCPVEHAKVSGWLEKAAQECIVVVWPTGNNQAVFTDNTCWNVPGGNQLEPAPPGEGAHSCCCHHNTKDVEPDDVPDADFLRESINKVVYDIVPTLTEDDVQIDSRRIYFSGFTNGCSMAMGMAALFSDVVAAVCCMAGSWLTTPAENYQPTPIWNLLGEEDAVVPYEGYYQPNYGLVIPDAQASLEALANLNGCQQVDRVHKNLFQMTTAGQVGRLYSDQAFFCQNDATVEYVTLATAGHDLYPAQQSLGQFGRTSFASEITIDTTQLAWDFCSRHALSHEPMLLEPSQKNDDTLGNPKATTTSSAIQSQILLGASLVLLVYPFFMM